MKKSKDYTLELIAIIGLLLFAIEYSFQYSLSSTDEQCQCILDEDE